MKRNYVKEPIAEMKTMYEVYNETMMELVEKNSSIVLLYADFAKGSAGELFRKNYILSDDNLTDLMRLTNNELSAKSETGREKLAILKGQISDIESRLERLYEALETGSFTIEELAPRIKKLQSRKEELTSLKEEERLALQSSVFDLPDIETIRTYINDLRLLLESSPIFERRDFLKSFVREIHVNNDKVTIDYTLPFPPKNSEEEVIEVLPFIKHGRPCRSRTASSAGITVVCTCG